MDELDTNYLYSGFINSLEQDGTNSNQRSDSGFIKNKITQFLNNFDKKYHDYVDALYTKYQINNDIRTSSPTSLLDIHNVPWFEEKNASTQWGHSELFREYIIKKSVFDENSEAIAKSAFDTSREFIKSVRHPHDEGPWSVKGQVFGNIQMGKTTNYCMLINRAIDIGYKVIIIATGIHSELRKQTQEEIDKFVVGMDTRDENKPFGVGENDISVELINQENFEKKIFKKNPGEQIVTITKNTADDRGDKGDINTQSISTKINEKQVTILVTKKNTAILENIIELFDQKGNQNIKDLPLLFIDDEADQASVNTNEEAELESLEDDDPDIYDNPTAINAKIRLILSQFNKHTYIGYSATPFCNAFIDQNAGNFLNTHYKALKDPTTKKTVRDEEGRIIKEPVQRTVKDVDDLFPRNFCHVMPVPSTYWGGREIFNVHADITSDDEDEITHIPQVIPIEDLYDGNNNELADDLNWCPSRRLTADFIPTYKGNREIPPSLRKAIMCFVMNVCIKNFRKMKNQHNTMLIHTSHLTAIQSRIRDQVREFQDNLLTELSAGYEKRFDEFKTLLDEYKNIQNEFNRIIEHEYPKEWNKSIEYQSLPDWDYLKSNLLDSVSQIQKAVVLNSSRDSASLDMYRNKKGRSVIVIGANKLNRGVVLKGLSVSYFRRNARQKDTLLQMGRWFGYRSGYKDICRYFTEREIINNYRESIATSENYKARIIRMNNTEPKGTPADLGLMIRHSPHIRVTRPGAMRNVEMVRMNYSNQTVTINKFLAHDINDDHNISTIKNLFKNELNAYQKINDYSKKNICIVKVEPKHIKTFLEKYKSPEIDGEIWNSEKIINFIESQNRLNHLMQWTVVMTQLSKENGYDTFDFSIGNEEKQIIPNLREGKNKPWRIDDNILKSDSSTWSNTKSDEQAGLSTEQVQESIEIYKREVERDYENQINKAKGEKDEKRAIELNQEKEETIDKIKNGKKMSPRILRNMKGTNGMLLFKWLAIKPKDHEEHIYKMGISIHFPLLTGDEEIYIRGTN